MEERASAEATDFGQFDQGLVEGCHGRAR